MFSESGVAMRQSYSNGPCFASSAAEASVLWRAEHSVTCGFAFTLHLAS
jgi:hypothetical protein